MARKALCIAGLACAGIVCAMGVSLFFLGGGVASYTTDVGCTMLTIPRDLLMGANSAPPGSSAWTPSTPPSTISPKRCRT